MTAKSLQALLEDIRLLSEDGFQRVQAVRVLCRNLLPSIDEEVKYGGILFASDSVRFAGVFAYRNHVSVEFVQGAAINDPYGQLEGAGKGRRHLKLRSPSDIEDKHVAEYLGLALAAAGGG